MVGWPCGSLVVEAVHVARHRVAAAQSCEPGWPLAGVEVSHDLLGRRQGLIHNFWVRVEAGVVPRVERDNVDALHIAGSGLDAQLAAQGLDLVQLLDGVLASVALVDPQVVVPGAVEDAAKALLDCLEGRAQHPKVIGDVPRQQQHVVRTVRPRQYLLHVLLHVRVHVRDGVDANRAPLAVQQLRHVAEHRPGGGRAGEGLWQAVGGHAGAEEA
mmetsp:Transcript_79959/g.193809  ORF Transcript_79959/g.193809 Transcript_79959/m.193809 type:complete len:214 (+) Transcript_79959:800-1441(+)